MRHKKLLINALFAAVVLASAGLLLALRDAGRTDGAACKVITNAIVSASAVEGIADYVTNNDIDLVVMGRRGLGRLSGMIGSVSFGVLRSVDVPVMTVK